MWENLSSGFPSRSDKIQPVQPKKMARFLKFLVKTVEGSRIVNIYVAKTKALISCAVTDPRRMRNQVY